MMTWELNVLAPKLSRQSPSCLDIVRIIAISSCSCYHFYIMVSYTLNVGLILIESFEFMFEEEVYVTREPFTEIERIRLIRDIYQGCHEFCLCSMPSFTLTLRINLISKCTPSLRFWFR